MTTMASKTWIDDALAELPGLRAARDEAKLRGASFDTYKLNRLEELARSQSRAEATKSARERVATDPAGTAAAMRQERDALDPFRQSHWNEVYGRVLDEADARAAELANVGPGADAAGIAARNAQRARFREVDATNRMAGAAMMTRMGDWVAAPDE